MTKNKEGNSTVKSKESKKLGRPKTKKTRLAIPEEAYRKLARIAEESRMPIQLVYEDAILNGISTLKEMYVSAISYRATRDKMINEPDKRVVQERKPQRGQATEPGEPSEPDYSGVIAELESGATENGFSDASIERGHETENFATVEYAPDYSGD
jgi:hypothetical protein